MGACHLNRRDFARASAVAAVAASSLPAAENKGTSMPMFTSGHTTRNVIRWLPLLKGGYAASKLYPKQLFSHCHPVGVE